MRLTTLCVIAVVALLNPCLPRAMANEAPIITDGTIINSVAAWTARDSNRHWSGIASSSDGVKLAAAAYAGDQIYTSTDSGATWTPRDSNRSWYGITSSSDGVKLAAIDFGGQIYTSTDSGVTWTARDSNRSWYSITSSSDGVNLAAVVVSGQIYTSPDSGVTWTARDSNRTWRSITSSSDGVKLAAVEQGGQIYTSTDSGATWTARDSNRTWFRITSSSDGVKLAAGEWNGQIYTSGSHTIAVTMSRRAVPTAFNLTLNATDADVGDTLTWSISSAASQGTATASGAGASKAIAYTPTGGYSGSDQFLVRVSDGNGGNDTITVNVTITNDNPTITGTPATTVAADGAYAFTPTGADANGDTVTYAIVNKPSWATFSTGTGALTGTPTNTNAGTTSGIVISVSDGTASTDLASFALQVTYTNHVPSISGVPAITIAEDAAYSFTPTAGDADAGDTLTFSIVNKPTWTSFSITTGALTGTPLNADVGTTTGIVITVTDTALASASLAAFSLTVTNTNDAPTISGTPATVVIANLAYSFIPTSADVDVGDTQVFSIVNKPTWASFNTTTGALTGTPLTADVGVTTGIVITVTDGALVSVSLASFNVTVTAAASPPPPVSVSGGSGGGGCGLGGGIGVLVLALILAMRFTLRDARGGSVSRRT